LIEGLVDLSSVHASNEMQQFSVIHEVEYVLKTYADPIAQKSIDLAVEKIQDTSLMANK
jgi:hypothetical protein